MTQTEAIPTGYKKTEIGVIPEDWEVELLGELFNVSGGFAASREQLSDVGFCYLHYGDIHNSKRTYIDVKESYPKIPKLDTSITSISKSSLLNDGDVVFVDASEDDEGASKHIVISNPDNIPYISGLHTIVLKSKDTHLKNIFKYYCFQPKYIKEQIKFYAVGTKVTGISKKNIAKIKIFFPTKNEEQIAIAKVLSDTDALIESLEKLIAKKKAIKQGAMQQLLTGKKRLPGFTGEWETKKLGEIVDFSNGKAHENFIYNDGEFIVVNSKFISSEGKVVKYSKQCLCPAPINSILFVMSDVPNGRAIAKCFLVDEHNKYTVNQRICALNPKINAKFLFYKVNRNPYYLSFDDGVKQTNLRKEDVLGCKIYIPKDKSEQTAIADILSDMDSEIEKLEQKRDKFILLKQGMMQQLLTGKIRLVKNGDN